MQNEMKESHMNVRMNDAKTNTTTGAQLKVSTKKSEFQMGVAHSKVMRGLISIISITDSYFSISEILSRSPRKIDT